ncbi:PLP-dependent aminotransferase family protein [Acetomicrobium hydrogeniformans]|uniref:PLP-dependent aminotransferase family protein n=1 Tax=Acetomicrobium hydrogeniformans TaxID=649746 RepID=A0A7V7BXW2_9BACT|nr:PLP-dependent aminotransferase family protein [Acetomicrobium hydrogeniformans]HHZ03990.1 PLP-dependent aminotransferase family protein [Acetomicrobium hydrogeniformans]
MSLLGKRVTERIKPSAITEMMILVKKHKAISLTAGEPSSEMYPVDLLRETIERALRDPGILSYYPLSTGITELREWIAEWMKEDGLLPQSYGGENVIMTNGSQDGLNLVSEAFIEPGDTVLVENPTYPEALLAFGKEGARFVSVPVDKDGPIVEEMEKVLSQNKVKLFYTIVNFQNPSGCVTTEERKKRILELASRYGFLIIEDDPYRYLRYEGEHEGSYIGLAQEEDRVIYLGSFSKIIAPGIRCGYMVLPSKIVGPMGELILATKLSLPAFLQRATWELLRNIDMKAHLAKLADTYRTRRDALHRFLQEKAVPQGMTYDLPKGGFFIWARVPWLKDCFDFAKFAVLEEKVGVVPGAAFYPDVLTADRSTLRLSFAKVPPETAEEAGERLGRALARYKETR